MTLYDHSPQAAGMIRRCGPDGGLYPPAPPLSDEDELVYTSEIVTREQIDALRRLLALPVVEGASFDFDYREPDEDENHDEGRE